MIAGQEFWIVASGTDNNPEGYDEQLQTPSLQSSTNGSFPLDVPAGDKALSCGSFDSLIRLSDELQKHDSQIDAIVHRLERQSLELDANTTFTVISQRQEKPFMQYFKEWTWDDAKYPRSRTLVDNVALLIKAVGQFDDETRSKTQQYSDLKSQRAAIAKKENASLAGRDLIDVFTPSSVRQGGRTNHNTNDFVYSEHLDTIVFILPKNADKEFLANYERFSEHVVPTSAKHFKNLDDKDGNMLWRAVCFKSGTEAFKKCLRDRRWLVRDFEYSPDDFEKLAKQRELLDKQVEQSHQMVKGLYKAAWSDTMVAWMHIKVARVCVESALRYGMRAGGKPANFQAFVITPQPSKAVQARKVLAGILAPKGSAMPGQAADDEDEYFPYVSLSFTPSVQR